MYFLVCLEFGHCSETFATPIARKVPDISVDGVYALLVLLQITFPVESFSARVATMFTNLGMNQEVFDEILFNGRSLSTRGGKVRFFRF